MLEAHGGYGETGGETDLLRNGGRRDSAYKVIPENKSKFQDILEME